MLQKKCIVRRTVSYLCPQLVIVCGVCASEKMYRTTYGKLSVSPVGYGMWRVCFRKNVSYLATVSYLCPQLVMVCGVCASEKMYRTTYCTVSYLCPRLVMVCGVCASYKMRPLPAAAAWPVPD